jgi:hypothetical protein
MIPANKNIFSGLLLLVFIVLTGHPCKAQAGNDSIKLVRTTIGTVYRQNGEDLSVKGLMKAVGSVPEALSEMKAARKCFIGSALFTAASAVLIVWPAVQNNPGSEFNWTPMAVGAGVFIASLPLALSFRKHAAKAVDLYNSGKGLSTQKTVTMRTGFTKNGIGLRFTF